MRWLPPQKIAHRGLNIAPVWQVLQAQVKAALGSVMGFLRGVGEQADRSTPVQGMDLQLPEAPL